MELHIISTLCFCYLSQEFKFTYQFICLRLRNISTHHSHKCLFELSKSLRLYRVHRGGPFYICSLVKSAAALREIKQTLPRVKGTEKSTAYNAGLSSDINYWTPQELGIEMDGVEEAE